VVAPDLGGSVRRGAVQPELFESGIVAESAAVVRGRSCDLRGGGAKV
jgi:hypothetical protein